MVLPDLMNFLPSSSTLSETIFFRSRSWPELPCQLPKGTATFPLPWPLMVADSTLQ